MSQYKYPEFILALSRDTMRNLVLQEGFNTQYTFDEFLVHVQSGVTIRQRNHLDEFKPWGENHKGDRNYSQWLNYFVVENHDGTINPYMRSREGTGESDLQGRGSIGVGGHTDFDDVQSYKSVIATRETVLRNVAREFFEECAVYVDGTMIVCKNAEGELLFEPDVLVRMLSNVAELYFEGILFDNSDNVGRLHFANALRLKLKEGVTVSSGEKVIDFVSPVRVQDLGATYDKVTFENWSKEFAFHLCNADAPNPKYNLLRFLPGTVV